ncbi:hypothetical protein N9164_09660 [Draconibacterium sp.]|nr:hypothetical protein [Draconibacterium sp.]
MFVGKVTSSTPVRARYGGGTYSLEGKDYTEYIDYHSVIGYEGTVSKGMTLYYMNDTLYLTYHPVDMRGNAITDITFMEKYVRY